MTKSTIDTSQPKYIVDRDTFIISSVASVPHDVEELVEYMDTVWSTHTGDYWFWTPEWQAKEVEADRDISSGRFSSVNSVEELLALLDAKKKEI